MRTGQLVENPRLCWSCASEEVEKASEEVDRVSEETGSFVSEETRKGGKELKREAEGSGRRKNPPPRAAEDVSLSIRREKRAK
jgi:hypothetical protein